MPTSRAFLLLAAFFALGTGTAAAATVGKRACSSNLISRAIALTCAPRRLPLIVGALRRKARSVRVVSAGHARQWGLAHHVFKHTRAIAGVTLV